MGSKDSKLSNEFIVEKVLGSGSFGMVIQAQNKFDLQNYAIKLLCQKEESADELKNNMKEIYTLAKISGHECVVGYKSSWIDVLNKAEFITLIKKLNIDENIQKRLSLNLLSSKTNIICIQMELCHMTLADYLLKRARLEKSVNERKYLNIFNKILQGLEHIHRFNFLHRDLKPENIFIKEDKNWIDVKIGDLGLAKKVIPEDTQICHTQGAGTLLYMAPEQMTDNYNKSVDIYAIGLILAELFSPKKDFQNRCQLIYDVRGGIIPTTIEQKWPEISSLIKKMTHKDPEERVGFEYIWSQYRIIKERRLAQDCHTNVICDGCKIEPIRGFRFKCKNCPDFDFCENCHESSDCHDESHKFVKLTEKDTGSLQLHTMLTELNSILINKSNCYKCNGELVGEIYKCEICSNSNYCINCYQTSENHTKIHKFAKTTVDFLKESQGSSNEDNDEKKQVMNMILLDILRKLI